MEQSKLVLQLETLGMSEPQKRLVRTILNLLHQVAVSTEEKEFFENSAELMHQVASFLQQSNFNRHRFPDETIDYAQQVVEFSIDRVQEALQKQKVINWDN